MTLCSGFPIGVKNMEMGRGLFKISWGKEGGLIYGRSIGGLKLVLKNTLEQAHLACKPASLLKMNFFTNIFQGFPLDFKSLFIVF